MMHMGAQGTSNLESHTNPVQYDAINNYTYNGKQIWYGSTYSGNKNYIFYFTYKDRSWCWVMKYIADTSDPNLILDAAKTDVDLNDNNIVLYRRGVAIDEFWPRGDPANPPALDSWMSWARNHDNPVNLRF